MHKSYTGCLELRADNCKLVPFGESNWFTSSTYNFSSFKGWEFWKTFFNFIYFEETHLKFVQILIQTGSFFSLSSFHFNKTWFIKCHFIYCCSWQLWIISNLRVYILIKYICFVKILAVVNISYHLDQLGTY